MTEHPLKELRLAVRMLPMQGKLVPALCCAETGRPIAGQVTCDVSVGSQGVGGDVQLLRVSSELFINSEDVA